MIVGLRVMLVVFGMQLFFYVTKSLALEKRLEKKRDTITMEFNVTVCDLSPRRRTKDDKGD